MSTIVNIPGEKTRSISNASTTIKDGNTLYVIEDVPRSPNVIHAGFDIVIRDVADVEKGGVIIHSYPYLNPETEAKFKVKGKTVRVSFS